MSDVVLVFWTGAQIELTHPDYPTMPAPMATASSWSVRH